MVPYLATKNFPVTPNYTVPKGAMIIPSCYPALHDPNVYSNPDNFDPERWISGDAESKTKNWLVFGAGPHDCLAKKYVPLSMAGMIGKAALELDWKHHATERSEEIRVFATLFPMVSTAIDPSQGPFRPYLVLTFDIGRMPAGIHKTFIEALLAFPGMELSFCVLRSFAVEWCHS